MKRALVLLLLAASPAMAGALGDAHLTKEQADDAFFRFLAYDSLLPPGVDPAVKALPPAQRAQLVKALGLVAKAIFDSKAFRARYQEHRSSLVPEKPKPARTGKAIAATQAAEAAEELREMAKTLEVLPEEQQAEIRKALAEAKKHQATVSDEQWAALDDERYQTELQAYEEQMLRLPPANPTELLRERLRKFLELTSDVDYSVKLVSSNGKLRFADEVLESKPPEWKMAFRAGKDASEAARAFAKAWLADLK